MNYIITLVGNSNVGKSTLFNRILLKNESLVSSIAGTTIDIKSKSININGKNFLFIDNIAYDISLEKKLLNKFEYPLKKTNLILLIVDNKIGVTYYDNKLLKYLLCLGKKIILIINKIDNNINNICNDFYSLGIKEIFYISSYYNKGINNMLNYIYKNYNFKLYKNNLTIQNINKLDKNYINTISIVGCPNVGKSTLLNSLIKKDRVIVSNIPGTTHDVISDKLMIINNEFLISDTAGIKTYNKIKKKIDKISIYKSLLSIKNSDLIIFIIDAIKGISKQDYFILDKIKKLGKSLIIVINKWDLLFNNINNKKIKQNLLDKLYFIKFSEKIFISAKYKIGLSKILKNINIINEFYKNKKITTTNLNKNLKKIKEFFLINSKIRHNKIIKLKYIHVGGYNPLKLIIHGINTNLIKLNYKKYIENYFYDLIKIKGIQIKIKFK